MFNILNQEQSEYKHVGLFADIA